MTHNRGTWIVKLITLPALFLFSIKLVGGNEPQSTISPSSNQYVVYNDPSDSVTFSTTQNPTPNCTGDQPQGPPTYYWSYGNSLDGDSSVSGSLKIKSDMQGTASVTVYCEIMYKDSNGNTYSADTLTSK